MTWEPPPYIPAAQIQSAPVAYAWDDADPYGSIPPVDGSVQDRLKKIADAAVAAFAAGCAEWVRVRFGKLFPDREPDQALEAFWAVFMTGGAVGRIWYPKDWTKWLGPVAGPVGIALALVSDAWINGGFQGGYHDAARSASLARLVLPPGTSFPAWQNAALTRLANLYPIAAQEKDPFGLVVVPEALDPAVPLTAENEVVFKRTYISRLDLSGNPFLAPPAEPPK